MRIILGQFNRNTLVVIGDDSIYSPPRFLSELSDRVWDELIQTTKRNGGRVWNGVIYRLVNFVDLGNNTQIFLGTTDFKMHYTTSFAVDKLKKIPFVKRPNGIYVSSYIETSDNRFVFGVKSAQSIAKEKINFIGGNLNKDEMVINHTDDIFRFYEKELEEELGVKKESINNISGLAIFQGDNMRICVLLKCDLSISSREIKNKSHLNFENKSILLLDKNKLTAKDFPKGANLNIINTLPLLKSVNTCV